MCKEGLHASTGGARGREGKVGAREGVQGAERMHGVEGVCRRGCTG